MIVFILVALRCRHSDMFDIQRKQIVEMRKLLERKQTHPDITTVIAHEMHCFCQLDSSLPPLEAHLHFTLSNQDDIGWEAFMRGYLVKQWRQAQHAHLQRNDRVTKDCTGHTWMRAVMRQMGRSCKATWHQHNTLVHGKQSKEDEDLCTRVMNQIRRLHKHKDKVLPTHRDCHFFPDLEESLKDESTEALQNYVVGKEGLMRRSMKLNKKISVEHMANLRTHHPIVGSTTCNEKRNHREQAVQKQFTSTQLHKFFQTRPPRPPKPKLSMGQAEPLKWKVKRFVSTSMRELFRTRNRNQELSSNHPVEEERSW